MDELCEYLSEIPPADISSFFKPGAAFVQRRLALRYSLMIKSQIIWLTVYLRHYHRICLNSSQLQVAFSLLFQHFCAVGKVEMLKEISNYDILWLFSGCWYSYIFL